MIPQINLFTLRTETRQVQASNVPVDKVAVSLHSNSKWLFQHTRWSTISSLKPRLRLRYYYYLLGKVQILNRKAHLSEILRKFPPDKSLNLAKITPARNGTEDNSSRWRSTTNLIVFLDDFHTPKLMMVTLNNLTSHQCNYRLLIIVRNCKLPLCYIIQSSLSTKFCKLTTDDGKEWRLDDLIWAIPLAGKSSSSSSLQSDEICMSWKQWLKHNKLWKD